jgi:hypothetical protein
MSGGYLWWWVVGIHCVLHASLASEPTYVPRGVTGVVLAWGWVITAAALHYVHITQSCQRSLW